MVIEKTRFTSSSPDSLQLDAIHTRCNQDGWMVLLFWMLAGEIKVQATKQSRSVSIHNYTVSTGKGKEGQVLWPLTLTSYTHEEAKLRYPRTFYQIVSTEILCAHTMYSLNLTILPNGTGPLHITDIPINTTGMMIIGQKPARVVDLVIAPLAPGQLAQSERGPGTRRGQR